MTMAIRKSMHETRTLFGIVGVGLGTLGGFLGQLGSRFCLLVVAVTVITGARRTVGSRLGVTVGAARARQTLLVQRLRQ